MTVSRETLSELSGVDVSRETFAQLQIFVDLLIAESERQNLIAKTSIPDIWTRHIADSLQLVTHAPQARSWLDIGSGAGLPGIPIAILTNVFVLLVDTRRLRTTFLEAVAKKLVLDQVSVATASIANVAARPFDAITARAVASLDRLLDMTQPFSHPGTILVFPKGKSAAEEVATAQRTWQGRFDIVPSRTDASAGIVVARDVRRRGK
ncbi:16S rRNA (guanine(527)-N(7))-methyltransferase RsmG [Sphingomonas antarctica]|uniref:16S rRNA (guanine(527)-N(7))-methyltransferase RsmG n=1 Tax=Sphingomonas antarctica TaxID=2040274 RepID=UPI0039EB2460